MSACALAVFTLLQIVLVERLGIRMLNDLRSLMHQVGRIALRDNPGAAELIKPSWAPLWLRAPLLPLILWAVAEFVFIAISGLVVGRGSDWRRWFFAVPALAWTALPAMFLYSDLSVPGAGLYEGGEVRHVFQVGMSWAPSSNAGALLVNVGAGVALMLALVPAGVLIATRRRGMRSRTSPGVEANVSSTYQATAMVVLLTSFGLWIYARTTIAQPGYSWTSIVPVFGPLLLLGSLTDVRAWWPAAAAVFISGFVCLDWLARIEVDRQGWPTSGVVPGSFALFALPLALGLAWQPVAKGIGWLASRPLVGLVALNVLNLVDGVLTWFATHHEQAVEANPVIRVIGLPLKIAAVSALGWVLYRARPRAVIWPVLAFVGVVGWHIAGYVVSSHLL